MTLLRSAVQFVLQWWPLVLLVAAAIAVSVFGAQHGISIAMLRARHADLDAFVHAHPIVAGAGFVAATALYLMLSLPAEGLLTAAGGLAFGTLIGSALAVAGALGAAMALYYGLRLVLRRQLDRPHGPVIGRVRAQMEMDGANYLLVLRLLPILPFALVSLLAVLVRMRPWPYGFATAAGTVPPTVVFASVGSGLGSLLQGHQKVDLGSLLSGQVLLPLVGLALLALLPPAWRHWRGRCAGTQSS